MSPQEFLDRITAEWGKEVSPLVRQDYLNNLGRFTEGQRRQIWDRVVATCTFKPRVADIHRAAEEIGLLAKKIKTSQEHIWHPTDCQHCGGEGRLTVIKKYKTVEKHNQLVHEVVGMEVFPSSHPRLAARTLERGEYAFCYRCGCEAGEAETICKAWPVWK